MPSFRVDLVAFGQVALACAWLSQAVRLARGGEFVIAASLTVGADGLSGVAIWVSGL